MIGTCVVMKHIIDSEHKFLRHILGAILKQLEYFKRDVITKLARGI